MVKPSERKNACSVASIIRKKFEKCTMPAMSVSANSTRRVSLKSWGIVRGKLVSALSRVDHFDGDPGQPLRQATDCEFPMHRDAAFLPQRGCLERVREQ